MKPPFRADHVGSLLRPGELHEARAQQGARAETSGVIFADRLQQAA